MISLPFANDFKLLAQRSEINSIVIPITVDADNVRLTSIDDPKSY